MTIRPAYRAIATAFGGAAIAVALGPAAGWTARPPDTTTLSNERTLSRWAYPTTTEAIRTAPSTSARRITKLRLLTEDRLPELYLLLAQTTAADGTTWVQLRVPKRPNGQKGWVRRSALGDFHVVRTLLVVNRRSLRLTLFKGGRRIFSAPVGVGKRGTETPAGRFWVREKFRVRGAPFYGPYAIGTSAYSPNLTDWPNGGVVGLHGTSLPNLIPGRPSHGCVRLRNPNITKLYRLLPLGTPVRIL